MTVKEQKITGIRLSELTEEIQDCISASFNSRTFWITAEIADVKRKADKKWCYLKFIEKEGRTISTEINAVFWSQGYAYIESFEKATKQTFKDGIEVTCKVKVSFHEKYGLKLEVLEIDFAFTLGKLELERQQTLDKLVLENPLHIRLIDEHYFTFNNQLLLPTVVQRIALITAPDSDGQRDFRQEIEKNKYGYVFEIIEHLTQIQGDKAHLLILNELQKIAQNIGDYDVVAIVRGGGSLTDLKPFDVYELAKCVASFPIPILTGIGHDRNTSIVDMMARQEKTPTKVANVLVERNFGFENSVLLLNERLEYQVENLFKKAKNDLKELTRFINASNPTNILKKGFAIIKSGDTILTNGSKISVKEEIEVIFEKETLQTTVTKKAKNGKEINL